MQASYGMLCCTKYPPFRPDDPYGMDKNGMDKNGMDKNGMDKNGMDKDGLEGPTEGRMSSAG